MSINSIDIATNATDNELAAWRQALDLTTHTLGGDDHFVLEMRDSPEAALASSAPLVGLSLLGELDRDTDFAAVEAAWMQCCGSLPAGRVVFISTILRHLPNATPDAMARLRRLNMLAARLSQRFGLLVIDIDRALAHRGALALATDAHLAGLNGQAAASSVIGGTVLAYGLNGLVDDTKLDAAITAHEARVAEEFEQVVFAVDMVRRHHTSVGGRLQRHLVHRANFDERGFAGLLRDFRRGRVSADVVAVEIGRKVLARLPAKLRAFTPRTNK